MNREEKIADIYQKNYWLFYSKLNNNLSRDDRHDLIMDMVYKVLKSKFDPFVEGAVNYMISALKCIVIDKSRQKKNDVSNHINIDDYHDYNGFIEHESISRNQIHDKLKTVISDLELKMIEKLEQGFSNCEMEESLELKKNYSKSVLRKMRIRLKNNPELVEYLK
jgi:hypothetical protein